MNSPDSQSGMRDDDLIPLFCVYFRCQSRYIDRRQPVDAAWFMIPDDAASWKHRGVIYRALDD